MSNNLQITMRTIDLMNCRKMCNSMLTALDQLIDPDSITDKNLKNNLLNIKTELKYMITDLDFYLNNLTFIDSDIITNLSIEFNSHTTKTSEILHKYKKYLNGEDGTV